MRFVTAVSTALLMLSTLVGPLFSADRENSPQYQKDVAPLLKKYCVSCHNDEDREGKLSLESFVQMQRGGERGAAILAGKGEDSRLIRVLNGVEPKMPPEGNEAPSPADVEKLIAWIDAGAKGPKGQEPSREILLTPDLPASKTPPGVTSAAWSPDGKWIAVARFLSVDLVNATNGKTARTLSDHPGKVNSVRFSRDGKQLVAASGVVGLYGKATIWNVADGAVVRQIKGHRDTMYAAVLDPSMRQLATAGYDGKIVLWDVASGEPLRTLSGHNGAIYDLDYHPSGEALASASGDETVKLWRVADGERLDTLGQPLGEQYVVRFSPDGRRVVAGGADNRIRVWRFVSRKKQRINPLLYARFGHEGAIVSLRFTGDGRGLVSIAADRTMKLWESRTFTQRHDYEIQPDVAAALATSPDGKSFFVGRMDGSSQRYPVVAGRATPVEDAKSVAKAPMSLDAKTHDSKEQEPNNSAKTANEIALPAIIQGEIRGMTGSAADADLFRFKAKAGEQWVLEVDAARSKSELDSRIEVLDAKGQPIPRVQLQAVRDSYFTFRGQNSDTVDGFRLHNWEEMELNEYLYADGEVVKLWLYPRGPDSGFKLYPGTGKRFSFFDTTPTSHPLQSPCFIVEPHAPGATLIPNGLPVFTLYYENDDESRRRFGVDSKLLFTAPADGEYLARLTDVRGFESEKQHYKLTIRPRRPRFEVTLGGANPTVNRGSGKEFTVTANRLDDFEGEIRVDIENAPPGFQVTTPLIIQAGQRMAFGSINALPDAPEPTKEDAKATKVTARAMIDGKAVVVDVNDLGEIKLGGAPKILVRLAADELKAEPPPLDEPLELTIAPGETITAKVFVERKGFKGRVSFGNDDSGRNLPHGVYVDNIGLNGLLIVEGQSERTFFLTAAKWAPETTRRFHLQARAEGNQTSWPVILHVRRPVAASK